MTAPTGTVFVVDDDPGTCRALARLCRAAGLRAQTFASAAEFLAAGSPSGPACLVLDVRLPGLSGLDLQAELAARQIQTPIVFITGHGDIPMSVRAMKAGAVDFLSKPFDDADLLAVIREALAKDVHRRAEQEERETIRCQLGRLTPRERQVFDLVIRGRLNKQIAAELGARECTIKIHRRRVMDKMQVQSVAELVQSALKAGVLAS